jgi:molybdopterin/thiamine biosynthesis adenylyltransferase
MNEAQVENARTLATLLNIDAGEAAQLLGLNLAVTVNGADAKGVALGNELKAISSRTVARVEIDGSILEPNLEIVIGDAARRHQSPALRVGVSRTAIAIGSSIEPALIEPSTPGIIIVMAAAYATGMALRTALGGRLVLTGPSASDGLKVPIDDVLGNDRHWMETGFVLEGTYLAGAGAVGNGFLYALQHFAVSGSLVIIDPDDVSDGNLNRCMFFTTLDVGKPKAVRLAELATARFHSLKLEPQVKTLQEYAKTQKANNWLKRLVVGVDSRRTRRRLQGEIPGEVFDASTTGVIECALHHHKQPTDGACLACIYHEMPDELARERHIAESLGVTIEDVKQHHVSADAAKRIQAKYSNLTINQIEGQAYDSLFKALCSEKALLEPDNRQVLAPFAFVSILAGAFLAIDVARRLTTRDSNTFNYWRFSPWAAPVNDLKQIRPRHPQCEFCGQPVLLRTARKLWDGQ